MAKCQAHVSMEERYARLEIDYTSVEEKRRICNLVNDLIVEHRISPQIEVRPETIETGSYIIEFHDDYDQKAGPFFEELLEALGIDRCD
ncbi:MAG: hypothetical protein C6I00_01400 [Nitratiruptor sp.]|nr:hypothetical protein [Nitratiruptor sp.]NPA83253.1 hypothetical protein [Campylobacterota bacterium]